MQTSKDLDVVNKIRDRSDRQIQRIVIDEVLPGGVYRVLSAEMEPGKET